jgi:hypothetical protein
MSHGRYELSQRQWELIQEELLPLVIRADGKGRPSLESTKVRDETIGLWELQDQRLLVRIAWFQLREAAAREV